MLPSSVRIRDLLTPTLTVDKVIHHARLQWARAEQSHQCDHIFEAVRLQTTDQIFHTPRFELEHRSGFRFHQHVVTFFINQRNLRDIDQRLAFFLQAFVGHVHRPLQNGQCAQA